MSRESLKSKSKFEMTKTERFWADLIETLSQKYNTYKDGKPGGARKRKIIFY